MEREDDTYTPFGGEGRGRGGGGNEVGDKPAVVVRDDNGGRERMPAETKQLDRFAMLLLEGRLIGGPTYAGTEAVHVAWSRLCV